MHNQPPQSLYSIHQFLLIYHQLKELEKDGLIIRKEYPQVPPKVEYYMSEMGKGLRPVVRSMYEWIEKNLEDNKVLFSHILSFLIVSHKKVRTFQKVLYTTIIKIEREHNISNSSLQHYKIEFLHQGKFLIFDTFHIK